MEIIFLIPSDSNRRGIARLSSLWERSSKRTPSLPSGVCCGPSFCITTFKPGTISCRTMFISVKVLLITLNACLFVIVGAVRESWIVPYEIFSFSLCLKLNGKEKSRLNGPLPLFRMTKRFSRTKCFNCSIVEIASLSINCDSLTILEKSFEKTNESLSLPAISLKTPSLMAYSLFAEIAFQLLTGANIWFSLFFSYLIRVVFFLSARFSSICSATTCKPNSGCRPT